MERGSAPGWFVVVVFVRFVKGHCLLTGESPGSSMLLGCIRW